MWLQENFCCSYYKKPSPFRGYFFFHYSLNYSVCLFSLVFLFLQCLSRLFFSFQSIFTLHIILQILVLPPPFLYKVFCVAFYFCCRLILSSQWFPPLPYYSYKTFSIRSNFWCKFQWHFLTNFSNFIQSISCPNIIFSHTMTFNIHLLDVLMFQCSF